MKTHGELEINNVNISSLAKSAYLATITNYGKLTINEGAIINDNNGDAIYLYEGSIYINSGQIGTICCSSGELFINGGEIAKLRMVYERCDAIMQIGNSDIEYDKDNPIINEIDEIFGTIYFYNGTIKSTYQGNIKGISHIRTNYETQITYNSESGLYEGILIPTT